MKRYTFILFALAMMSLSTSHSALGQENQSTSLGFEFQAYPTGLIPGLRIEKTTGNSSILSVRLGYNWIRHRDLGKHDDERGQGYGITLGYKKYIRRGFRGWHLGLRTDVWRNSIDWYDDVASGRSAGNTKITVVQPTAELGHTIQLGSALTFTPTLSFGWEWNVKTEGEPTGEGAILLLGFHFGHLF